MPEMVAGVNYWEQDSCWNMNYGYGNTTCEIYVRKITKLEMQTCLIL